MSTIKAGTTTTTAFSVDQDTTGDLNFQAGSVTPLSIKSTGLVSVSNTASFKLPVGGMASRPASPQNGMMRFNSDLNEVEAYAGNWQALSSNNLKLKLDFDETTTLDSRISFTRATNGTYFDSAGVLRTAGSGVARFDHRLEGSSWVNKGLLIEEQRTNILTYSEEMTASGWTTPVGGSVSINQTMSPAGTTTADYFNSTSSSHILRRTVSVVSGTVYAVSVYAKSISGTTTLSVDLGDGTNNDFTLTSEWQRFSFTATANANQWVDFRLNGTGTCALWGAQVEAGAFPTSYIATSASSVTRNADVASMTSTNFSSWYNATEGTLFYQFDSYRPDAITAINVVFISDGTNNERIQFSAFYSDPNDLFSNRVFDGNVLQANLDENRISYSANTTYKNAFAVKANDFAASTDGNTVVTDTSGTMPTVDRLFLGAGGTGTGQMNGHIAKFYYWNTRRPNEILQNLTE